VTFVVLLQPRTELLVTKERPDMDLRVKATINLMHESLTHRLSIRSLARTVNLSSTRLRQLFRKETGRSPLGYLNELRLESAAQLLRGTFLSVKEVTSRVGIRDTTHFVRSFKKQYGLTPSEFRVRSGALLKLPMLDHKSGE
jgi:transcriptional regulator GlxA family with amidase domain